MQTDLDRDITRVTDAVTADGQMFALKTVTRRGVDMPAFVNAPPSLAHYFAHFCNQNKDALFLVDGDQRLIVEACIEHHGQFFGRRIGRSEG